MNFLFGERQFFENRQSNTECLFRQKPLLIPQAGQVPDGYLFFRAGCNL